MNQKFPFKVLEVEKTYGVVNVYCPIGFSPPLIIYNLVPSLLKRISASAGEKAILLYPVELAMLYGTARL